MGIKYDFTEMPKDERKKIYADCLALYVKNYKMKFDWLPDRIESVSDDDIRNMAGITALTGVDIVTPFLRLREGVREILKWL